MDDNNGTFAVESTVHHERSIQLYSIHDTVYRFMRKQIRYSTSVECVHTPSHTCRNVDKSEDYFPFIYIYIQLLSLYI